jgi:DNA-binding IclR family transcriptional regulator
MRVGERVPLRPPIGGTFLAWMTDEEIAQWLSRRGEDEADPNLVEQDLRSLELVRERGYLIAVKSPAQQAWGNALAVAGRQSAIEPQHVDAMIAALYGGYQLHEIDNDALYDLSTISGPIFDMHGQAVYALSLSGYRAAITGAEIDQYARQVLEACAAVMRENDVRMPGASAPPRTARWR